MSQSWTKVEKFDTMSVCADGQAYPTWIEREIQVDLSKRSSWVDLTKAQDEPTLAEGRDKSIMFDVRDKSPQAEGQVE